MIRPASSSVCSLVLALTFLACGGETPNTTPGGDPDAGLDAAIGQICRFEPSSAPNQFPCGCDRDCQEGAICSSELESGSPGGQCFNVCDAAKRGPCPAGSRCIPYATADVGQCQTECDTSADCPPMNVCDTEDRVCYAYCTSDGDCTAGHCDLYRGMCVSSDRAGGGIAAPCVTDDNCRSNFCSIVTKRCENSCVVGRTACPEAAVCVARSPGNAIGICRPPCLADGTCSDASLQCRATGQPTEHACFAPEEDRCLGRQAAETDGLNCDCPSDCKLGSQCYREADTGDPFGDCSSVCTSGGNECGPGRECTATATASGFCRLKCTADTDCAPGDHCNSLGHCFPLCQGPEDCAGKQCNLYSGYCEATPTTGLPMGAPCTADVDCRSQFCSGTYCTGPCTEDRQLCPDGAVCVSSFGTSDRTAGVCFRPCKSNADCPVAGTKCTELAGANLPPFCY